MVRFGPRKGCAPVMIRSNLPRPAERSELCRYAVGRHSQGVSRPHQLLRRGIRTDGAVVNAAVKSRRVEFRPEFYNLLNYTNYLFAAAGPQNSNSSTVLGTGN